MKPFYRINQRISAGTVRLIDSDGTQLGIKSLSDALGIARTRGLDLVEIAAQANPPVCKILDFPKFRYEQEKRDREAHKNQKSGLLKEVRLRPNIAVHDLETKVKQIEQFLKEHDKVRIAVVFRGRENQHKDLGAKLLKTIQERLNNVSSVESGPFSERNSIMVTLIPKH